MDELVVGLLKVQDREGHHIVHEDIGLLNQAYRQLVLAYVYKLLAGNKVEVLGEEIVAMFLLVEALRFLGDLLIENVLFFR